METHGDKTHQNTSQQVPASQTKQRNNQSTVQLVDNRPEALAQKELIHLANNSPQVKQLRGYQAMADNFQLQNAQLKEKSSQSQNNKQQGTQVQEKPQSAKEHKDFSTLQLMPVSQHSEAAPFSRPFVVQRQVTVGLIPMSLEQLKRQVMIRQDLTRREVNHVFANADGRAWESWSTLAIWTAFGLQLMEMDEDKEGEFNIDKTNGHGFERHQLAGIWDAGAVLTAHPDQVAIFRPGVLANAEHNMPDRFTAWTNTGGDRWDAELNGVHYQGQWDVGNRTMHLLTCYPVSHGTGIFAGKERVKKALEMAKARGGYDEFERLVTGLVNGNRDITREVDNYKTGAESWFAARMGGSSGQDDGKKGGGF